MERKKLVLAAVGSELQAVRPYGLPVAHLAYRITGGRLMRDSLAPSPRETSGGLLVVCDAGFNHAPFDTRRLCADVLAELTARGFTAVVADFVSDPTPALTAFLTELDALLAERSLPLYIPPAYASFAPNGCVLLPSAVTEGAFRDRLREAASTYGDARLALEIVPLRIDFPLPCPDGAGRRLSAADLDALVARVRPMSFFSSELCAKYFTYADASRHAHFVLYDDAATVSAKLAVAARAGVTRAFMLYAEVAPYLSEVLEQRE